MNYADKPPMNYADKLRLFADWLDGRPELLEQLPHWDFPGGSIYTDDKELFGSLVRWMGSFDKSGYNGVVTAAHVSKTGDGGHIFRFSINLTGACEARAKLDDGKPVMRRKKKYVETDEWEPEQEWICPESFLNL